MESIQHNAALAITGAVRGTSWEKLYQELGFESFQQRRWYRKLFCLFKIISNQSPSYLFPLVSSPNTRYPARKSENIPQLRAKYEFFKSCWFPSTIKEWSNLDSRIRKFKSIHIFKSNILKFIQPKPNNVYYCHNPKGMLLLTRLLTTLLLTMLLLTRLLTRLPLGLSHLREHKFKHSSQDCPSPLCFCGTEIETSTHNLLHCPTYTNKRMTVLNKIKSINCSILEFSDAAVTKILVFGDNTVRNFSNTLILNSTIDYILSTKRFDDSILTPG